MLLHPRECYFFSLKPSIKSDEIDYIDDKEIESKQHPVFFRNLVYSYFCLCLINPQIFDSILSYYWWRKMQN